MTERISNTSVNALNIIQDSSDIKTKNTDKTAIPNELIKEQDELSTLEHFEDLEPDVPQKSGTLSKVIGGILVGLGALAAIAGSLLTAGLATGAAAVIAGLSGSLLVGFDLSCLGLHILAKSDHLIPQQAGEITEQNANLDDNSDYNEGIETIIGSRIAEDLNKLPAEFLKQADKVKDEVNKTFGFDIIKDLKDLYKQPLSTDYHQNFNHEDDSKITAEEFGQHVKEVLTRGAKKMMLNQAFSNQEYNTYLVNNILIRLQQKPELQKQYESAANAEETNKVLSELQDTIKLMLSLDNELNKVDINSIEDNVASKLAKLYNLPVDQIKNSEVFKNKFKVSISTLSTNVMNGTVKVQPQEIKKLFTDKAESFYQKLEDNCKDIEKAKIPDELKNSWKLNLLDQGIAFNKKFNMMSNIAKAGNSADVSALVEAIKQDKPDDEIIGKILDIMFNKVVFILNSAAPAAEDKQMIKNLGQEDFTQIFNNLTEVLLTKPELKQALQTKPQLLQSLLSTHSTMIDEHKYDQGNPDGTVKGLMSLYKFHMVSACLKGFENMLQPSQA